jgi:methyl-accepting chemotaxis protein
MHLHFHHGSIMKFRNLRMRAKLMLGFAAMALIVLIVAGLAQRELSNTNERFTGYLHGVGQRQELATSIRAAVMQRGLAVRNMALVESPAEREKEKTYAIAAHGQMQVLMPKLKSLLDADPNATAEEHQIFANMQAIEAEYGPVALDIVKLASEEKISQAILRISRDCRPLLAKLVASASSFVKQEQDRATQLERDTGAAYRYDRSILVLASMLAVAFAIILGWWISKAIISRLARAVNVAEAVAAGDLGTKIVVDSTDEMGQLLGALKRMNESLVQTVGRVRSSADGIATASAEIAMGNQDLSGRTEQQASALQQTAASMQQMTTTVQQNADSSRQASQLAATTAEAAGRAGKVVQQVVSTMGEISAASRKISDIIGVIDGIAFQTNILALNAAVEAARAGEQGRGFAVVASEVRSLAQRSAQAAREIKGLIGDSVSKVAVGSDLVSQAGSSMEDVQAQVRRMTDLIAEIHASTDEQSTGIVQVNQAVASIDQGTQQNAALVEESAAAAESLKQQAVSLMEAIAVFRSVALTSGRQPLLVG